MYEDESKLSNKRIAKNTIVLYVRTIFTLFISLYTSRAILNILGVENYGINNAVGGFVSMFSMISATLVASTQRFLTYELGKQKNNSSQTVFSVAMTIHVLLGVILLLLFETIGLWFLNERMNIDASRLHAANWVYQCSILSFLLNVIRSPFEASIIAHEKMSAFAYVNIFEALLRLGIVFLLLLTIKDRLILYSVYVVCISILIFVIYVIYCKSRFEEIRFKFINEKSYYKDIVSFAGYNFLGSVSMVLSRQCVNVISNIYFGVVVNAARGITTQVEAAINKFVNDFSVALNPQITKSYAQGNKSNMMNLIYRGAKFSYFLYLFFAVPIIVKTPIILQLWLKIVPDHSIVFVRLALVDSLITTLSYSISTGAMATGNIKKLSIWIGIIRICVFPVTYFAYELGFEPYSAFVVLIIFDVILFFVRLIISDNLIGVQHKPFIYRVILPISVVSIISFSFAFFLNKILVVSNLFQLLLFVVISCIITIIAISLIGFDALEREFVVGYIKKIVGKK